MRSVSCPTPSARRAEGGLVEDAVSQCGGIALGRGQADDLAPPVAGMGPPFHESEMLELIHDDRGVGAIDAVRLGEVGKSHRLLPEQEQYLDPPTALAQAEPVPELVSGGVGFDELPHQLPSLGRQAGRGPPRMSR
jgi:hypothetical protein